MLAHLIFNSIAFLLKKLMWKVIEDICVYFQAFPDQILSPMNFRMFMLYILSLTSLFLSFLLFFMTLCFYISFLRFMCKDYWFSYCKQKNNSQKEKPEIRKKEESDILKLFLGIFGILVAGLTGGIFDYGFESHKLKTSYHCKNASWVSEMRTLVKVNHYNISGLCCPRDRTWKLTACFSLDKSATVLHARVHGWCNYDDAVSWGRKTDDVFTSVSEFSFTILVVNITCLLIFAIILILGFIRVWCNEDCGQVKKIVEVSLLIIFFLLIFILSTSYV